MVLFRISGSLPAPWEDFVCADESGPHITLMTRANAEACGQECSDGSDGWLDIVIDVPEIGIDVARLVIAEALGIEDPEDVIIEQAGLCQSV